MASKVIRNPSTLTKLLSNKDVARNNSAFSDDEPPKAQFQAAFPHIPIKPQVKKPFFDLPARPHTNRITSNCDCDEDNEPEEMDIDTLTKTVLLQPKSSKANLPGPCKKLPTAFALSLSSSKSYQISSQSKPTLPKWTATSKPSEPIHPSTSSPALINPVTILQKAEESEPIEMRPANINIIAAAPQLEAKECVISEVPLADTPLLTPNSIYKLQFECNLELDDVNQTENSFQKPLWCAEDVLESRISGPDQPLSHHEANLDILACKLTHIQALLSKKCEISMLREQNRRILQEYQTNIANVSSENLKGPRAANPQKMTLFPQSYNAKKKNNKPKKTLNIEKSIEGPTKTSPKSVSDVLRTSKEHIRECDYRPGLHVTIIGPSNSGKSSLLGRLLHASGAIDDDKVGKVSWQIEKYRKDLKHQKTHKTALKRQLLATAPDREEASCWGQLSPWAWLVDEMKQERRSGRTCQAAHRTFYSQNWRVHAVDTPSQRDALYERVGALAQADVAIVTVNIDHCPSPDTSEVGDSSLKSSLLEDVWTAASLGVRQFLLVGLASRHDADNKRCLTDWEECVKDHLLKMDKNVVLKTCWVGNLWRDEADKSGRFASLLATLDSFSPKVDVSSSNIDQVATEETVFLVHDVFRPANASGCCVSGQLLSGVLVVGSSLQVAAPSTGEAAEFTVRGLARMRAPLGQSVGTTLNRNSSNLVVGEDSVVCAVSGDWASLNLLPTVETVLHTEDNSWQPPMCLNHALSSHTLVLTSVKKSVFQEQSGGLHRVVLHDLCPPTQESDTTTILCPGQMLLLHCNSAVVPAIVRRCYVGSPVDGDKPRSVRRLMLIPQEGVQASLTLKVSPSLHLFSKEMSTRLRLNEIILTKCDGSLLAAGQLV